MLLPVTLILLCIMSNVNVPKDWLDVLLSVADQAPVAEMDLVFEEELPPHAAIATANKIAANPTARFMKHTPMQ